MADTRTDETTGTRPGTRTGRSVTAGGVLVGMGLGGFVDGIVLHQILQWHHLLTDHGRYRHHPTTVADLEDHTRWDGIFHAGTWTLVVLGLFLLATAVSRRPWLAPGPRQLTGLLLAGWGLFNLIEGVVNHHLLTLHHVRDDITEPLPWDLAFLTAGAALLAIGALLQRTHHPAPDQGHQTT
jgi:uncharacterized membrane protein